MDFSKMDFKKIIDINELKKTLTRLENIAALGFVLFFFFPWISMGPLSVNGFGAASHQPLFFLVPILGILIIAMRPICQMAIVLKSLKLAAGFLPILGLVMITINGGSQALSLLGMGVWLTMIAAILIILGTLDKVQLPNALPAMGSEDSTEDATESKED